MGDELDGLDAGPYPIGNAAAQPDLRFAFPSSETGARYQKFRLIVRPDLWGRKVRLRFSNALGTRPVTFDGVHVGLQRTAAALVPGSNQPISLAGKERDYGRDVLSLSGIAAVVWLGGLQDFSKNGHAPLEAAAPRRHVSSSLNSARERRNWTPRIGPGVPRKPRRDARRR